MSEEEKKDILDQLIERMRKIEERVEHECKTKSCFDDAIEQYVIIENIIRTLLNDVEGSHDVLDELFDLIPSARSQRRVKLTSIDCVKNDPDLQRMLTEYDKNIEEGMSPAEAYKKLGKGMV